MKLTFPEVGYCKTNLKEDIELDRTCTGGGLVKMGTRLNDRGYTGEVVLNA